MKRFLLFLCLLLSAQLGLAQALPDCVPKTMMTPFGTGRGLIQGTGVGGGWADWQCPRPDGTWAAYYWVYLDSHAQLPTQLQTKIRAVLAAPDPQAAAASAVFGSFTSPTAAEVPTYNALNDAARNAMPASAPPTQISYVVTGAQAFSLKADGTRSTTPASDLPTRGEPCDCAVQVLQFGARFCKVPRISVTQVLVAGCSASK